MRVSDQITVDHRGLHCGDDVLELDSETTRGLIRLIDGAPTELDHQMTDEYLIVDGVRIPRDSLFGVRYAVTRVKGWTMPSDKPDL